jgi:hypothetical protein
MQGEDELWKNMLVSYVLESGDSLDFTKHFWRGCEPIEVEVIQYHKFAECLRLARSGWITEDIALQVDAGKTTVFTWKKLTQMPKLAHFLKAHLLLGNPEQGTVWLTTECTHGHGIPIGDFIRVPLKIDSWSQMSSVLDQLRDMNEQKPPEPRCYLLGFLIGIMIGDASKSKSKRGASHRHVGLVLSKKYETNVRIGDFTVISARSIGLRMHRTNDLERPAHKPNGFFQWVSQASPLVDWMYNVALGLEDDELTTYDAVRADWMLSAPREFRVGVINGVSESDGSVALASQEVEFWVDPHRQLLKRLLEMEGLRAFNNRQALTLAKSQAIKSFSVPIFNATLRTVRYQRHEIMATARTLEKRERVPEELRTRIIELSSLGFSVPEIVTEIASERKILLSFEATQRWARRAGGSERRKS